MPTGLLETALGVLRLALLFTAALFMPIILQLSLLFAAGWILKKIVEWSPFFLAALLFLIGVPVHEFSHAVAFLMTLSGVAAIKPIFDELGYAFVESKRGHCLGALIAAIAPLFGGMLVIWLTTRYIIPGFEVPVILLPKLDLESASSFGSVLKESMNFVDHFLRTVYGNLFNLQWGNWRTYVGLYIAVSVGAAIAPSGPDLKIFAAALPLALIAMLGLFTWLYLAGDAEVRFLALQEALLPHILNFAAIIAHAFVLTSLGVLLLSPFALWRRMRTA